MKESPKISIITTNFNKDIYLEQTILSVLNQDNSNFEYIIIDVKNTNYSIQIKDKYQDKIDLWITEPCLGIYNAMNKAIDKAVGEYILFLSSGNRLYSNNIISRIIFELVNGIDLVYGNLHRISIDGREDVLEMPSNIDFYTFFYGTIPNSSTFINRALFSEFGKYREDLLIASDWAFLLKIFSNSNVTTKYLHLTVSSSSVDILSMKNNLYQEERKKVLSDYFSEELLDLFNRHHAYKTFFDRKSAKFLRYFLAKKHHLYSKKSWIEFIHQKRYTGLISLINLTVRKQLKDPLCIPIIIVNYNRLTYLQKLISQLLEYKHNNIIIIDNDSTYIPLLKYYDSIKDKVTIERMTDNYGHLVFWKKQELFDKYAKGYYVITDSDVLLNNKLPSNYMEYLIKTLNKNPELTKVGFALDISDIPNYYSRKDEVMDWEDQFWKDEISTNVYKADIDTTFALYRPLYRHSIYDFFKAYRIAGDYTAKHQPWYINLNNLTKEDLFYNSTSNASNTWKLKD